MPALLLALSLLAPPPVAIEATGSDMPTRALASRDDVLRLCKALEFPERHREPGLDRAAAEAGQERRRARALESRYAVEVAGRGLVFDYDDARQELTLSERAQLVGAGGSLRVWAVEGPELPLPAEAAVARRIVAAARNGEGRLRLLFVLPEDEEAAICAHAPGTRSYGLGVEPVGWAFLIGEEVLARGGAEEAAATAPARAARPALPVVELGDPVSGDGPAVRRALRVAERGLLACYRKALQRNPGIDGALALELELPPEGGRSRAARVAMDTLHEAALSRCVIAALAEVAFPAGKGGKVQVPLHFRLDPAK